MWNSLIRIQKILQRLRPLKITFCEGEDHHGFFTNPLEKNFKMRLIDRNLGLIVIASLFGLKQVLSDKSHPTKNDQVKNWTPDEIKQQTQKLVLGAVLFILHVTLFIIC